jgi:hypothetical protein
LFQEVFLKIEIIRIIRKIAVAGDCHGQVCVLLHRILCFLDVLLVFWMYNMSIKIFCVFVFSSLVSEAKKKRFSLSLFCIFRSSCEPPTTLVPHVPWHVCLPCHYYCIRCVYAVKETFIKKYRHLSVVSRDGWVMSFHQLMRTFTRSILLLHRLYVQHSTYIYIHVCVYTFYFSTLSLQGKLSLAKLDSNFMYIPLVAADPAALASMQIIATKLTSYCYLSVSIASTLVGTISHSMCISGNKPQSIFHGLLAACVVRDMPCR